MPAGARHATLNINGIDGGQAGRTASRRRAWRTAAARCSIGGSCSRKASTRRKAEIVELLERAARATSRTSRYEIARPDGRAPDSDAGRIRRVIGALDRALQRVLGRSGGLGRQPGHLRSEARGAHRRRAATASPYGPGILDLAHQPDEWCGVDDLVNATKVLALALLELTGTQS